MPITLRSPNNPTTDVIVLTALRNTMLRDPVSLQPNTNLANIASDGIGLTQCYIHNRYRLATGDFPAAHLAAGPQTYTVYTTSGYLGILTAWIDYYDRWDQSPNLLDDVRASIAADLERLKANLESNPTLNTTGTAYTVSLPKLELTDYEGELDQSVPGLTLVTRRLTVTANLLPYGT